MDPAQIELARRRAGPGRVRFLVGDVEALPFGDAEFDLVFTNKVTHHVPNWQRALAESSASDPPRADDSVQPRLRDRRGGSRSGEFD